MRATRTAHSNDHTNDTDNNQHREFDKMFMIVKKHLLAASVSVAALLPYGAMAQEAVFVLGTNESGHSKL